MARTGRKGPAPAIAGAVALLAAVSAGGLDTSRVAGAAGEATTGRRTERSASLGGAYHLDSSGVPRIEENSCPPRVPVSDRVRCLTLVVPEGRQAGTGSDRVVRLPVAIVAASDPGEQLDDPVLWIDYDAGDGFLAGRVRFFTEESLAINAHRDVITLDLRGSGLAEPALTCPEVTELNRGAFAAEIDETTFEGRAMRLDAIEQCHDRLVADGVDVSAYAADDAAQDLEDLRQALGVAQWNLVAGEYGSKLAQLLARDHPDSVRSVVVNSTPIPLQADWFSDLAGNAAGGWAALVALCTADPGCAGAYPRLADRVETLVAELAAEPRHYDDIVDVSGVHEPYLFTASRLLTYLRYYVRDTAFFPTMPLHLAGPPGARVDEWMVLDPDEPATLIYFASDARLQAAWGLWEPFPQNQGTDNGSYALGAHLSALCRDEAPFVDPARLARAATVPLFGPFLGDHADLEACDVWAVDPAPSSANEPVESDVPFLVLAGDLDTVSSPAWADAFAEGLSAAQVVHLPLGTQPTGSQPSTAQDCARQIRDQFLAAPTETVDRACLATSHGPAFVLPP